MLDNILIMLIFFSIVLSFFVVIIWKKKHFVKELYISEGSSITIYIITVAITIGLLIAFFAKCKGLPFGWLYLLIVLLCDLLLLFIFLIDATTCIYLKDKILYKKNIFITKKILLNRETVIVEKIDRRIIKFKNKSISISSRYLSGSINNLINNVKNTINK